jgi:tRNA(fMet)-specific endonuclease VapC
VHYLLDTNILSYFLQGQTSIVTRIRDAGGLSFLSISTITVAESMHGVIAMQDGAKKTRLLASLEQLLATGIDVRPFSIDAARVFAEAKAKLEAAGVNVSFPDLAIASIAMAENKTLVSNDGVFEHVERVHYLRFERWEP